MTLLVVDIFSAFFQWYYLIIVEKVVLILTNTIRRCVEDSLHIRFPGK